jgi:hypothetical protein
MFAFIFYGIIIALMQNHVLQKKIEYEGCPIYVRTSGESWEYLTIIRNELYTASIVARLPATARIFGQGYTSKQISDCTQYMLAMAQATIDHVLGINHKESPYVPPPDLLRMKEAG